MAAENEFGSVEGQLVGLPLAGPETFSVQQLAYLKRALGLDETVLYSNNNPEQTISSTTLTLSESYLNFERIKIYLGCSAGSTSNTLYSVEGLVRDSQYVTELSTQPICLSGGGFQCDCNSFSFNSSNPTQCSVGAYGKRITVTAAGAFSSTNGRGAYIFKIVGIHRIAGGN